MNTKSLNVALVYSGQPRLIQKGLANHNDVFSNTNHTFDVYADFWDTVPYTLNNVGYQDEYTSDDYDVWGSFWIGERLCDRTILNDKYKYNAHINHNAIRNLFLKNAKSFNIVDINVSLTHELLDTFVKFQKESIEYDKIESKKIYTNHSYLLHDYSTFITQFSQQLSFAKAISLIKNIDKYDLIYRIRTDGLFFNTKKSTDFISYVYDLINTQQNYYQKNHSTTIESIVTMPNIEIINGQCAYFDIWSIFNTNAVIKFKDIIMSMTDKFFDNKQDCDSWYHIMDNKFPQPFAHKMWDYYFKKAEITGIGARYVNNQVDFDYNKWPDMFLLRPDGKKLTGA